MSSTKLVCKDGQTDVFKVDVLSGVTSTLDIITSGQLRVCDKDMTPSSYDIFRETSFAATNGAVGASVAGLSFAGARGFKAWVTVSVVAAGVPGRHALFELEGIRGDSDWTMSASSTGADTGVAFGITPAGQVVYTSAPVAGWTSTTMKFRAWSITA